MSSGDKRGSLCVGRKLAPACALALGAALAGIPAGAATPVHFVFSGRGLSAPVIVSDVEDVLVLEADLCSGAPAETLEGRPALEIQVVWVEGPRGLAWAGSFYPAADGRPAAVDIPDWTLYDSKDSVQTCHARVVGPESLRVLSRSGYDIPVKLRAHQRETPRSTAQAY